MAIFQRSLLIKRALTTAQTNGNTIQPSLISWQQFFDTRRKLQLFQRAAGLPFTFGFLTAESMVLSLPVFDPTRMIFGMDPLVVVGLSTIGGSIASYIAGVAISGWLWRRFRPNVAEQLNTKQKNFYARISKYRANVPPNPTQMNFSFDYYGEKVRSVSDYRTWLRRQYKMKADRTFKMTE